MALEALGLFTLIWLAYAAFVIRQVRASRLYDKKQFQNQMGLALLLPLFGAVIVHLMLQASRTADKQPDKRHDAHRDHIGPDVTGNLPHSGDGA